MVASFMDWVWIVGAIVGIVVLYVVAEAVFTRGMESAFRGKDEPRSSRRLRWAYTIITVVVFIVILVYTADSWKDMFFMLEATSGSGQ